MKKILLIFLFTFVFIINVNAECKDVEIKKWVGQLELKRVDAPAGDYDNDYYVFLYTSRDDVNAVAYNDLYPGDVAKTSKIFNGNIGFGSKLHFDTKNYTVKVYMNKDAAVCPGEYLTELTLSVPQYNYREKTAFCETYPDSELCDTMSDVNDLTDEEFIKQAQEYENNKKYEEKPKTIFSKIFDIFFGYVIWALVPALVIAFIYKAKIKKAKKVNDEK